MAALTIVDALDRARGYGHAVVSFVGDDGYPESVAGPFTSDPALGVVDVGPIDPLALPQPGQEVCVTFSHIRPQKGMGYDERRYVNLWGTAVVDGDRLRLTPIRATGWDEQELP